MKKLLLIFLLTSSAVVAQEAPPTGLKITRNTFYTLPSDGQLWLDKGSPYGWGRIALFSEVSALSSVYVPQSRTITINGTAYDLTANRSWSIPAGTGTVESITPGIGFNSETPITTNGTLNLDTVTAISGIPRKGFVTDYAYSKAQSTSFLNGKANLIGGNVFSSIQQFSSTFITSSGNLRTFQIIPTYSFSSTAGYTALFVSPFATGGSGPRFLIDAGTNTASDGSGTHTSKFRVDENGRGEFSNRVSGADPSADQDFVTLKFFNDNRMRVTTGSATANGSITAFVVPISGFTVASQIFITPITSNAANYAYISKTTGSVTINYTVAPPAGTISWDISYYLQGIP